MKLRTLAVIAGFLTGASVVPASAQVKVRMSPVVIHKMMSKQVGDSFEIRVLRPRRWSRASRGGDEPDSRPGVGVRGPGGR